jgi:hypothetical protein
MVLSRGRALVPGGCTVRGLTLYYFLRRAGVAVNLCYGVALVQGRLVGHCWLERAGEPFLERPRQLRFTPAYTFPAAPLS